MKKYLKSITFLMILLEIFLFQQNDIICQSESVRKEIKLAVEVDTYLFNELKTKEETDQQAKYRIETQIKNQYYEINQYLNTLDTLKLSIRIDTIVIYDNTNTSKVYHSDLKEEKWDVARDIMFNRAAIQTNAKSSPYDLIIYLAPNNDPIRFEYYSKPYNNDITNTDVSTVFNNEYHLINKAALALSSWHVNIPKANKDYLLRIISFAIDNERAKTSYPEEEIKEKQKQLNDSLQKLDYLNPDGKSELHLKTPKAELNSIYKLKDIISIEWYYTAYTASNAFKIEYSTNDSNWIFLYNNIGNNLKDTSWVLKDLYYSNNYKIRIDQYGKQDVTLIPFTVLGHTKLNRLDTIFVFDSNILTWQKCDTATYKLQISKNANFTDSLINTTLTDTLYNLSNLSPDTYYWRVSVIYDPTYETGFLDIDTFYVDCKKLPTIKIADNSENKKLSVELIENIAYQWFKDGTLILDANSNVYNYTENGDYYCEISNDCYTTSSNTYTINLTSVFDLSTSNLIIYPNPFDNIINVNINIHFNKIVVTDSFGRIVYTKQQLTNKNTIQLSSVSPGVYFISLYNANKVITKKIVKY